MSLLQELRDRYDKLCAVHNEHDEICKATMLQINEMIPAIWALEAEAEKGSGPQTESDGEFERRVSTLPPGAKYKEPPYFGEPPQGDEGTTTDGVGELSSEQSPQPSSKGEEDGAQFTNQSRNTNQPPYPHQQDTRSEAPHAEPEEDWSLHDGSAGGPAVAVPNYVQWMTRDERVGDISASSEIDWTRVGFWRRPTRSALGWAGLGGSASSGDPGNPEAEPARDFVRIETQESQAPPYSQKHEEPVT